MLFIFSLAVLAVNIITFIEVVEATVECSPGYYMNNTCQPCSQCRNGRIRTQCSANRDTVCEPCPSGQYLSRSSNECSPCTDCESQGKEEVVSCSPDSDASCGKCLSGYFLQISAGPAPQCLPCSQCPPGDDVVKWYECSDMPDDQQCAPGNEDSATVVAMVTEQLGQWELAVSRLSSGRTVFLPVPSSSNSARPAFEIIISVLSLLFTFLTCFVFVCTLRSMCRRSKKLSHTLPR